MITRLAIAWLVACGMGAAQPLSFDYEVFPSKWSGLNWYGEVGRHYDLLHSENLTSWAQVDGFPRIGTGKKEAEYFPPANSRFFRMAVANDSIAFLYPEVAAYKTATGISRDAALEIHHFLSLLRGAGVDPALFWVGGSRYGSVQGTTVRAVIGGTGNDHGPFDLIFVDADHDYESAFHHSAVAFGQLAPGGVILWHDYQQNNYLHGGCAVPESLYMAAMTFRRSILSIEGTMLGIYSEHPGWETSVIKKRGKIESSSDPWSDRKIRQI